jgi:diguanylate cyclase (GGDEF)-like protein
MGPSARRSDDLEVALGHVRLGLLLTWLLAAAGVAYALLTPGAPNRVGLVATFAGAMVVGAVVSRVPLDGVLAGRWREPFFIGWSSSYLVLIAVLCLIDGGVSSALASLFFVPILFSALAYERLSVEIVSGVGLIAYAAIAAATGRDDLVRALYPMVVLVATTVMGVRFAQAQADRRAQLETSEERYRRIAQHDALTDLPNRRFFLEQLRAALEDRRREHLAVLLLDLDDFKLVNDSLGHEVGDELLRAFSARLSDVVREGDLVARLGGDEFVVLCPGLPSSDRAEAVAARVATAWSEPFALDGREIFSGASIGIALAAPGAETGPEQLLREADAAMYRAKERGYDWALFHEELQSQALQSLKTESELRLAVERDELRLAYQPIVCLHTGRPLAVEALLRWQHPERGLLAPAEFLDAAERTGLIVTIGRWCLLEACSHVASWSNELELTVNVSARQIAAGVLVDDVRAALAASGLAPQRLGLELTEHTLIEDPAEAERMLLELRELGVRVLLDDFGTGYSSLAYLRRFPIDAVKIDRSFIGALHDEPDQRAIVEAIVRMAGALRLDVVAEGVERTEQLQELRAMGGERAQGYLFARPLLVPEIDELLDGWDAPEAEAA